MRIVGSCRKAGFFGTASVLDRVFREVLVFQGQIAPYQSKN